jgi:environmental stress-induced protein Ves
VPVPWRNGGGVTREVARCAAPAASPREFLWRISIASVALAGPFSRFDGFERLITVIEGAGMRLRGLAVRDTELRPYEVHRFDGATAVEGLLPLGAVTDLNVIYDASRCEARLAIVEGAMPVTEVAFPDRLVVNLAHAPLSWHCAARTGSLAYLDAIWVRAPETPFVCARAERAALIELEDRSSSRGHPALE